MEVVASPPTASPGANGVGPPPFASVDPERVIDYLTNLLEIALGATREELHAEGSFLSDSLRQDALKASSRFANDNHVSLLIQKEIAGGEITEDDAGEPRMFCILQSIRCLKAYMHYLTRPDSLQKFPNMSTRSSRKCQTPPM